MGGVAPVAVASRSRGRTAGTGYGRERERRRLPTEALPAGFARGGRPPRLKEPEERDAERREETQSEDAAQESGHRRILAQTELEPGEVR